MRGKFHRLYETPNDGGQVVAPAGEEPVVVPQDVTPEQMIVDRINEVNAEADAADAAKGTGSGTPDFGSGGGQQVDPNAQAPGTAEDLILGRFKSTDDVITAYQNLEPEYTQTRQQMKDMERQIAELQAQLAYTDDDDDQEYSTFNFEGSFSNNPQNMEELEALAAEHPDKAALWAINNAQHLDGNLVREVVNYWHSRDPAQATAYMLQQMFQSYMPQIDQRLQPHDTSRQESIVSSAIDAAEKIIGPTYGEYHDRIIDAIEANPAFLPADTSNTEALSQAIVNVYAMLVGQEQLQRGKQLAAQGQPQPATPSPAVTQTRTAAVASAPAATEEDVEAARQIQQLILNAQG